MTLFLFIGANNLLVGLDHLLHPAGNRSILDMNINKNIVQTFSFESGKNLTICVMDAQQEVQPILVINPSLSNGSDLQKGGRVGQWLGLGAM